MFSFVTTRFNNETILENRQYREKKQIKCIYGSSKPISPKIHQNSVVFVVEMNNQQNIIEGIGLIRNSQIIGKSYKIYKDYNYNRYIYKSNYHIPREKLIEYNHNLVYGLDQICFHEKTHLKRGSGFTTIPEKLCKHEMFELYDINLKKDIQHIFIRHFRNQDIDEIYK